jgi:Bacterial regulatory proteins, gntR family
MSNTADIIRAKIYNAIVEQRLPPGTKLGEKSLWKIFGVSRTLIRRLANDHVVESRPHRGDLRCLPGSLRGARTNAPACSARLFRIVARKSPKRERLPPPHWHRVQPRIIR